jgi:hypothetical protein
MRAWGGSQGCAWQWEGRRSSPMRQGIGGTAVWRCLVAEVTRRWLPTARGGSYRTEVGRATWGATSIRGKRSEVGSHWRGVTAVLSCHNPVRYGGLRRSSSKKKSPKGRRKRWRERNWRQPTRKAPRVAAVVALYGGTVEGGMEGAPGTGTWRTRWGGGQHSAWRVAGEGRPSIGSDASAEEEASGRRGAVARTWEVEGGSRVCGPLWAVWRGLAWTNSSTFQLFKNFSNGAGLIRSKRGPSRAPKISNKIWICRELSKEQFSYWNI